MTGHEHPRPESTSAAVDEQMLEDFLNQHLLGSRSGVKAFRAAEQTWAGTPQEAALRTRGSGWTQVELDLLQGMLQAKLSMWRVLEQLAPHLPAVDAAEMQALRQRAADQQREVQRITSATLEGRFLAG